MILKNYLEKSSDYTKEVLEAMTTKLQYPKTAANTYWAILSRLLYKKKNPAILSLVTNDKFASDICKKANIFNNIFCDNMYTKKNIKSITIISW